MNKSVRSEFDSVDRTTDPSDFVQYLDTTRATDFFQEIKRRTFGLMEVRAGQNVADIGCGTGEDVMALAAQAGPSGRAVGVDISSTMIATANQRSRNSNSNVEFVQGDVQNLPFDDACFDAIRAERLLQHTPDVDLALREMARVVTRGGRIVSWEADLDLFIIDATDYHTSRIIQRFICDSFQNGSIGHRIYRRFLDLGFVDVQSTPLVQNFADFPLIESAFDLTASVERAVKQDLLQVDQAMRWLDSLRSASHSGHFISTIGGFITFGRKS
jgi:ubiquinone/menaquinone biosynthesis C-methylase UbiE